MHGKGILNYQNDFQELIDFEIDIKWLKY